MTIGGQSSGMTDTRPRLEVPAWRESIVQGFMRVEDAVTPAWERSSQRSR